MMTDKEQPSAMTVPARYSLPLDKDWLAIIILAIFYTVGIFGILLPVHEDFIMLTPGNLLLSLALLFWRHPAWNGRSLAYVAITYLVGFGAEVFGVQTGILFGDYSYGSVLGWKAWDTPLMIGLNWVMLGYSAGAIANYLLPRSGWWGRGLLAAALMVGLDVLIEPVAIHYGFWEWEAETVPLRNYLGWFLVALPLECLFAFWLAEVRNKVAVALFILQFLFFGILGISV